MISQLKMPLQINNVDCPFESNEVLPEILADEWTVNAALAVSDGCLYSSQAVQSVVSSLGLNGEDCIIERALLSMQLVVSCRAMLTNAGDVDDTSVQPWRLAAIMDNTSGIDSTTWVVPAVELSAAFRSLEVIDPTLCIIAEAAMLGGMTLEEIAIAVDQSCALVGTQWDRARRLILASLEQVMEPTNSSDFQARLST